MELCTMLSLYTLEAPPPQPASTQHTRSIKIPDIASPPNTMLPYSLAKVPRQT